MLNFGDQVRFVAGCVGGLRQPCWALAASLDNDNLLERAHELDLIVQPWHLATQREATADDKLRHAASSPPTSQSTLEAFIALVQQLHAAAGLPFIQRGLLMRRADSQRPYLLLLPTLAAVAPASLKVVLALRLAFNAKADALNAAVAQLQTQLQAMRDAIPAGANLPHLLRHAWRLGIPAQQVSGGVFQFGQGANSHWLDSTFTEATSRSAAQMARDKLRAAQTLRLQGLPVPRQRLVADADAAVSAARELGGLVVVKPANLDGGLGVWTALGTESMVRQAYSNARSLSPRVLLEEHLPGRDHRLVVFQGELLIAVERVPASVVGDGAQDITSLVTTANLDPRRSGTRGAPLKPLALDDEAMQLLDAQGVTPASIPARGQRITLRRTANVATGGWPVDVTAQVHPDNRALAIAAARALRLDLAGIDLLCPDISRSWREVGGGICEVNAQPNIGVLTADHLFDILLRRLVPRGGRIPVVVVAGSPRPLSGEPGVASWLSLALKQQGHHVGLADRRGIHVDGHTVSALLHDDFQRCRALLLDSSVNCLVVEATDPMLLDCGLPLDRIDVLVADDQSSGPEARGRDLLGLFLAGQVTTLLSASPAALARARTLGARCALRQASCAEDIVAQAAALVGSPVVR